ncbi:tyrosine-type recombinase/integrase [Citrobacter amalonaticus]|uniref:tyrosine-type recombinase/integrase n=2 Tax=Citrobacter amalonaticus TaxID=35703 RepID=UPI0005C86BF1|nr:tyrosine-type recombinase/integrase [Citrobacter amalonaticus]
MIDELKAVALQRAAAITARKKTTANILYGLQTMQPVLCLGVREASTPRAWERFTEASMSRGIKPATMRQRLNCLTAVLSWVTKHGVHLRSMSPRSAESILKAAGDEARRVGRMVKRHKNMTTPSRVDLKELPLVIEQVESLREPYRSACRIVLCMGTRIQETLYLSPESVIGGRLFIPGRVTKNHSDLVLPLPVEHMQTLNKWLETISEKRINYDSLNRAISRAGIKWRAHDLRKLFRTACAVRGEDYIACELILNHDIQYVPAVYLQKAPYKAMRRALKNAFDLYFHVSKTGTMPAMDDEQ